MIRDTQSIVEVAKARTLTSQILELALASMTPLKTYKVAVDHLVVAEAHAGPHCDIMGIYEAVRVESGTLGHHMIPGKSLKCLPEV